MDNQFDLATDLALRELSRFRETRPCDTFEQASDLLSDYCLCGHSFDMHEDKTADPRNVEYWEAREPLEREGA